MLKNTLLNLLCMLSEKDRLCIIQFNNSSERLTPLLRVDSKNMPYFKDKIVQITGSGGTNINAGMTCAFEVLKQRRQRNAVTGVFLLSDGLDLDAEKRVKVTMDSYGFFQNSFNFNNSSNNASNNNNKGNVNSQKNLSSKRTSIYG